MIACNKKNISLASFFWENQTTQILIKKYLMLLQESQISQYQLHLITVAFHILLNNLICTESFGISCKNSTLVIHGTFFKTLSVYFNKSITFRTNEYTVILNSQIIFN